MIEIIPNWHPLFVHFPIAFATAAVFFSMAARMFKEKPWAAQCLTTGRWMLWGAAIFACIAAVFGWFAYNSVDHDEAGHLAMTIHAYWALATLGALVLLAAIELRVKHTAVQPTYGYLAMLTGAWLLVVSTAWHGGEVVFRHGIGVMALPAPEVNGHSHEHGADTRHEDEHTHCHDDTASGDHLHDVAHMDLTTTADGAGTSPKKAGHSHAQETPPHKD